MRFIAATIRAGLVFVLTSLPLTGCKNVSYRCDGGTQLTCVGPGGCQGTQHCFLQGDGYTACECGSDGGSGNPALTPNLLLLLDKSGSMRTPLNLSDSRCPSASCPGALCPADCPTRLGEARAGLRTFLQANGKAARLGLVAFPTDAVCGAPTAPLVELSLSTSSPGDLQARATLVDVALQGLTAEGGAPVAPALSYLATYTPLLGATHADYVVLVTDGLPNCNAQNPNSCLDASACQCTSSNCGTNASDTMCRLGCLDSNSTVAAATRLRALGVRTVVVGLGEEAATSGVSAYLGTLATAGGFTRACPQRTDAECAPNDTCDRNTRRCTRSYYVVNRAAELAAALSDVLAQMPRQP